MMSLSKQEYKALFDQTLPWANYEISAPTTEPAACFEIPISFKAAALKVDEFISHPVVFPELPPYETLSRSSSVLDDVPSFYRAMVAFLLSQGIPFVIDADFCARSIGNVLFEVRFYRQLKMPSSVAWADVSIAETSLVEIRNLGADRTEFAAFATKLARACGLDFGLLCL